MTAPSVPITRLRFLLNEWRTAKAAIEEQGTKSTSPLANDAAQCVGAAFQVCIEGLEHAVALAELDQVTHP